MRRMKMLCVWLAAGMLLCAAASCGSGYRDDLPARTVSDAVIDTLAARNGAYYTADDDTYAVYFGENKAYAAVQDCTIFYHSDGTNIDQMGVFRVRAGEDVGAVQSMVEAYLNEQCAYLRSFAANYQPDELTKLDGAKVQLLGRYVVFTILNQKDTAQAMSSVRKVLAVSTP